MMGHSPATTTQGVDEGSGSAPPLVSRSTTWVVWKPILRKAAAVVLGGLGLAGVGALSMAPAHAPANAASSAPALAGVLAPTEWLASGTPGQPTSPAPNPCPPSVEQSPPAETAAPPAALSPQQGSGVLPDGRIVLNLATPTELTALPGIGQKKAEAIVALRTKLKGFRKLSDLLRVKGIGVKSLKKLEPKLVLDVPAPAG